MTSKLWQLVTAAEKSESAGQSARVCSVLPSPFKRRSSPSSPGWLARAVYAKETPTERKNILIAIFQRGAVDGLNVVLPHSEPNYYALRPGIAIPRPDGTATSALDLDGFGLNPAPSSLKPLWERKQLAIVEAVGSDDPTRSHFDAQDYMESGTPGRKATADGWLNRAICPEPSPSPPRSISLGSDLHRTMRGKNEALALAIGNFNDFQVKDQHMAALFESMYGASTDQVLNGTARETFDAIKIVQSIHCSVYSKHSVHARK